MKGDEVISANSIFKKIKAVQPEEIAGHIGDLINMESALAFKKLFKILKSNNKLLFKKNTPGTIKEKSLPLQLV